MADRGNSRVLDAPRDELGEQLQHLVSAVTGRVLSGANDRVGGLTEKLSSLAEKGSGPAARKAGRELSRGRSPLRAGLAGGVQAVKSKVGDAFGTDGKQGKVTNIIEEIDVGAPVRLVYDRWTQFQEFSGFMKKVENVEQQDDQKLTFKAQVLWSHRSWEAQILEQVPDKRIVWRSQGKKGHVDGAVTFHEIGPELTRVLVVLEYHPQGLFERVGNLWRAQGRRVRLELKHFRRQVMAHDLLHPDDVAGWRGEIHDGQVQAPDEGDDEDEYPAEDESDDEADDDADDDEADDDEADDDAADEADDEADDEAEDDEAEDDEADESPAPRRRRATAGRRRAR